MDPGESAPVPYPAHVQAGDWNALHRDLYGDFVFPPEVVINLSSPGIDHTGGKFLLYEQRARDQSGGTARSFRTATDWCSGSRLTLGLIFHDAS